jgi:hypothetical protein
MSTAPYGQPEPFDATKVAPATLRMPARPARPWLKYVAALVIAVVGFGAGFGASTVLSSNNSGGANDRGGQFPFGPGASGRPGGAGGGGFGRGASGTVGSVSADQMTITTAAGGSRIVLLTPSTTVTEVSSATKALADLASGQTVTIIGSTNPDGSVTATSVVIGNLALFGRGGFGGGGPAASGTP